MALRRIVAKRISRLKEAGAETPIINEVPLPAEVLSVEAFLQPTIDVYERIDSIRDIIEQIKKLPQIAYGSVYGAEAGRWYKVTYPKIMPGAVPVAIGAARGGTIFRRTVPKISIPKVSDIITKEIIRITRHDFNNSDYCDAVASGARDRAKGLSPPWPLDIIWGFVCDTLIYWSFYAGWYAGGWILNVLWDSFVQPQIDKVRDSINSVVADANKKINDQLTEIRDSFSEQLDKVQDAVNLRLDDLYKMWGVPENMAVTPLHLRNKTDRGFEFQSYGKTTCYWIAVARSR